MDQPTEIYEEKEEIVPIKKEVIVEVKKEIVEEKKKEVSSKQDELKEKLASLKQPEKKEDVMKAEDLLKQELAQGNAIANHSWSHDYHILYPNRTLDLDSFLADYKKTDDLLKKILGPYFSTRVIRCLMNYRGVNNNAS